MKSGYNRQVVSEEKSFEIVDGWTTNRRVKEIRETAYTIDSLGVYSSGELNSWLFSNTRL